MPAVQDYIYPGIFEFIGSVILGAAINQMKREATQSLVLPFVCLAPHVIAWRSSRGHLNPAVSLANLLRRDTKFNFGHFLIYIIAQFSGFLCGLMLAWWFNREPGRIEVFKDAAETDQIHEAVVMEFVGSLIFIIVHLLSTHTKTSVASNWGVNCIVVSFFYGSLVYIFSTYTGGSFNPAYGFAQNITDLWKTGKDISVEYMWMYVLVPLVAAFASWPIYEIVYKPAYEATSQNQVNMDKLENEVHVY